MLTSKILGSMPVFLIIMAALVASAAGITAGWLGIAYNHGIGWGLMFLIGAIGVFAAALKAFRYVIHET